MAKEMQRQREKEEGTSEFEEKVIYINRCSKVTTG